MKRIITLALVMVLALSALTACGRMIPIPTPTPPPPAPPPASDNATPTPKPTPSPTPTPTPTPTPDPTPVPEPPVEDPGSKEIAMPESSSKFYTEYYRNVITQLQVAGFTNIETNALYDIVTGWFTDDGSVESVSVNGKTDFKAKSKFPADAKILITYHTYYDNKPLFSTDNGQVNESTPTPPAVTNDSNSPDPNTGSSGGTSSGETTSQKNAVRSAKDYLKYSAFSRKGLIEQLEFEGFPVADAEYGADHSGADWMKQAERSALEYLDFSAFSRQGLIEQLEYEGFTHEQAVHGVEAVGL